MERCLLESFSMYCWSWCLQNNIILFLTIWLKKIETNIFLDIDSVERIDANWSRKSAQNDTNWGQKSPKWYKLWQEIGATVILLTNTSLGALGAVAHHLQRCTAKSKMAARGPQNGQPGRSCQFLLNKFFKPRKHSIRKGCDIEENKSKWKSMVKKALH